MPKADEDLMLGSEQPEDPALAGCGTTKPAPALIFPQPPSGFGSPGLENGLGFEAFSPSERQSKSGSAQRRTVEIGQSTFAPAFRNYLSPPPVEALNRR
jgi:hypothetical protein